MKSFALICLFFISSGAVYMNRYQDPIKTFYLWSMADALILFPLLDLVTGLISDPSSPRQGECPAGGE